MAIFDIKTHFLSCLSTKNHTFQSLQVLIFVIIVFLCAKKDGQAVRQVRLLFCPIEIIDKELYYASC